MGTNLYNNAAEAKKLPKPLKRKLYAELRVKHSYSNGEACAHLGISRSTGNNWAKQLGVTVMDADVENFEEYPDPIPWDDLSPPARRGLEDFLYFCTHYLENPRKRSQCLDAPPYWAEIAQAISDPAIERLLITVHPGVGKTYGAVAYIIWRITRERAFGNRSFSVLYGSGTDSIAAEALRLLNNWATSDLLVKAYGRFKPISDDDTEKTWTKRNIVVAGMGAGKGSTLSIWTITGKIRGVRPDLMIWDDPQSSEEATPTLTADLVHKWDSEIEDRLEPGGKLAVVGTYAGPIDLQHELLRRKVIEEDGSERTVWSQIKFPAHDESKCGGPGKHGQYPEGCLLWPERKPYRSFLDTMQNKELIWKLQWQLEDIPEGEVLVPLSWVEGGRSGSHEYPGCLDLEREMWQPVPKPGVLIAAMDPSPTQWTAIQLWLWSDPFDYLIAFERLRLRGDDEYFRVISEWTARARELGLFDTWIIERTGSIYLHDALHQKNITQTLGISIIPHETARAKSNLETGVWSIRDNYRYGRVKLPYAPGPTQHAMKVFIDEHTRYPFHPTDDSVLTDWFYRYWKNSVSPPAQRDHLPKRQVPSWFQSWVPARAKVGIR